jgi:hypothetical protein
MTTPLERLRDALTAHGCNPRGTAAKCPAHDDRRASLSIGPATQFRGALVNCHVGCHLDDILEKLGLKLADLFDEPRQAKQGYAVVAEYPYRDESGKVLYFKERRYPKDFRQYHLVNGEKVWNLNGVRRVLYRLPEILAPMARGETIYLCEGEKDAEELAKRGVATTTWTEGAWQPGAQPKWRDEYSKLLDGANVCIIQHRDENGSGQATAHDIATELKRYTKTVRIVEPAEGNDAYDYLNAGKTVDDFVPVADDTPPDAESSDVDRRYDELVLQLLDAKGLRNIPSPTPLVENWLFKDSLAWIQGKWGHGKSFLAVDIGCCVATGTDWHGKPAAQGVVLYLIAEGASGISQRVDAWEAANGLEAKGIVFLPSPVQLGKTEHIDVAAFRMLLHAIQPALVIIDTQARLTVGCDENSSKDMGIFVDVLETLRKECGSTMLVVHTNPATPKTYAAPSH